MLDYRGLIFLAHPVLEAHGCEQLGPDRVATLQCNGREWELDYKSDAL